MKYLSFRTAAGYESVGAVSGQRVIDVGTTLPAATAALSPMRRLILNRGGDLECDQEALSGLPGFDIDEVTLLPLVPDPTKIVAAPVNYRDHQSEMNQDAHIEALGFFLKAPSSVCATASTVQLPYNDRRFDQEGELALVIGRTARHVRVEDALDHVAGYTCLLDMTMRGGEDRSTRKSFDTFTPVGPHLVTPDEVGSLQSLQLRLWVNGTLRQSAAVADLIWDVPHFLSYASSVSTLHPGDVLTTGTPAGVGQVRDGDVIRLEIDRVGRLEAAVSAAQAVSCPTKGANRGPKPPTGLTPVS